MMVHRIASTPVPVLALFAAIVVYGMFGSPTPDNPGAVEAVVGALLILAAGMGLMGRFRRLDLGEPFFLRILHVLFLTGITVPVLTGIYNGNEMALIVRDLLSFAFLCLPIFLMRIFEINEGAARFLPILMLGAGAAFAVRTLIPAFNLWIADGELLYLSNSPLVLFAAIFTAGFVWRALVHISVSRLPVLIGGGIIIAVIVAAMLLDIQRATIAAIGLSLFVFWGDTLIRTPGRIVLPTILLMALLYIIAPWVAETAGAIYKKTAEVGMNMRVQEAGAVFASAAADPVRFFAGSGWGGVFASPAVGGLDVNYTHSLLTLMFLKGGALMALLATVFCIAVFYEIVLIFQRDRGRAMAVFWPFIIPVFLYASHKSLDFGLLLLLIGVWSKRSAPLRETS